MTPWIPILLALFLFAPQSDFQTQFVNGLNALNQGKLAEAQTSLLAAGRLQPQNPRVLVALAQTYRKLGKTALAADAAAKAERAGADDPVTLHTLAAYYSEQKRFAKAAELEAKCAEKDHAAVPRAMTAYLLAEEPKKAIDMAVSTSGWEENAEIRNLLGRAYEAYGQILKTIPELEEAIRLKPDNESYYFDLMQVLLSHYNFDVAIQAGEAGRKIFPWSAQMAIATGVAYFGRNQSDAAIDAFLAAIDLDPAVEQPYFFLSRLLGESRGRLPEIARRFADFEKRNPQSYLGYFLHARSLMVQSLEPEHAEGLLRKSIALDAQYWESHFNLGALLGNRGAWAEAEKEFRRSTELNPKDPTTHYRLFRALAALGRTQEAEAELARQREVAEQYQADLDRTVGDVKRLEIPANKP